MQPEVCNLKLKAKQRWYFFNHLKILPDNNAVRRGIRPMRTRDEFGRRKGD